LERDLIIASFAYEFMHLASRDFCEKVVIKNSAFTRAPLQALIKHVPGHNGGPGLKQIAKPLLGGKLSLNQDHLCLFVLGIFNSDDFFFL
jgi:hypothetical protein